LAMGRCLYCYGVVTKQDAVCYTCGEGLPKRAKAAIAKPISALSNMLFVASLSLMAFSFFSSHRLPLTASLAVSGVFLVLRLADRFRSPKQTGR
jgi:hypothetical protein